MNLHDRRRLYAEAKAAVAAQETDPRRLILIHTGAVLLLSLLITVINSLLDNAIADTGGLSGLGRRSVLTTAQSCLRLLPMLLMPFWNMGYTFVTLKFARRERSSAGDLTAGFRRFLPVLRLQLLLTLVYVAMAFAASQLGTYLFMLTPWAQPLLSAFNDAVLSSTTAGMEAALMPVMEDSLIPLMLCYGAVFLLLAAPFYYRLRQAELSLLDDPQGKALAAMGKSRRLMRKNVLQLVKLDLHFWWFYALDLLATAVCYLDVLLPLLGIALPVSSDAAYYGSLLLYMLCQLALYLWRRNQVSTAYALYYEKLQRPVMPDTRPQDQPWV